MGYYDSLKRTTGKSLEKVTTTSTGGYAAALERTKRSAAEKSIIKNPDVNSDGIVDIRDVVRAKKITNESNEYAKDINKQATDTIKNTIISPDYFSGDFNGDLVVDEKDEKIYKQIKKLREADVNALEVELNKLKEALETTKNKKKNIDKARADTLNKKGVASIEAFKQKDSMQQDYEKYLKELGYSSVDELQGVITEKTAFLNNAKKIQYRDKLYSVDNSEADNYDPEFDKYKEAGYDVSIDEFGKGVYTGDSVYDTGSFKIDDYRAAMVALYEYLGKDIPNEYKTSANDEKVAKYRDMEYDELRKFAYYLGKDKKEGTTLAKDYIDSFTDRYNAEKGEEIAENIKDRDILRYLYSIPAGLDQFVSGVKGLLNISGEYMPTSAVQYASAEIGEAIYEENGTVGKAIYDLGTTTANMLPSILVGVAANLVVPGAGAVVGAGLMGASAGGNAYQEMINLGYDKSQAQTYGLLIGASEAALGYAFNGISAIGGKVTGNALKVVLKSVDNGLAKIAINLGGKMLSEGFEESMQELLEPLFENIALKYSKNDLTDIKWDNVVYSGVLGALSAGLLEGIPSVRESIKDSSLAKAEKLSFGGDTKAMSIMADEALASLTQDSEAYKIAEKYKKRVGDNKKLSGTQLHELREIYESAVKEKDKVKIKKAVAARLEELGETANIEELSAVITKGVAGEKTTMAERKLIKQSKYGERVTNELTPNELVRQQYSSYWTELIETERIHSDIYNKSETALNDSKEINELEDKILAKADETLTNAERAIKQRIYERRSRQKGLTSQANVLREQGGFAIPNKTKTNVDESESGNEDQTENRKILTNSKNALDSMLDEDETISEEAAEERAPFTEPSEKEIYRKATDEERWNAFYQRGVKQRHISDIAKKLDPDMKVLWVARSDERLSGNNGKYIRSTNTIYLATDLTVVEMYIEVFKHEFMHRLESKGAYIAFKKYLFDKSTAFEQYVRSQLKIINKGRNFEGSREEAIKELTDYYLDRFKNDKMIGPQIRDKFTFEEAQKEIVADFAGEVLFKGKANRDTVANALANEDMLTVGEIESTEDALEEIAKTDRNLLQRIVDVIKEFIRVLRGQPQTKSLVKDLEYIENRLARVYDSADTKKAATLAGEELFSIAKDDNGNYVKVDTSQELFDGKTIKEMQEIARKIIRDNFKGKILDVGENGKVYVSKRSSDEYAYPANRRMDNNIKETKMRTAPELDNLLSVSKYIEHQKDDGRHPNATGGWDVYSTRFEIAGNMFVGEVKIMITDRGYIFYDVTKIRRTTRNGDLTERNSAAASGNPSIDSIHENKSTVNINISKESENYSSDESFSVGSPMQEARGNLERYESGEISREDFLKSIEDEYWNREIKWAREGAKLKSKIKAQNKERAEVKAEVRAEREEKATKQSNIEHIRKTVSRIDKMFRTNSDNKHIPEKLKEASAYFIKIFLDNDASPFDKKEIRAIRTLYNDLIDEGIDGVEINGIDEGIPETIKRLEKMLDGKTLRQLNGSEILLIKEITDNFMHIIKDENEVFIEGKKLKLSEIGERFIDELKEKKAKRENALLRFLDKEIKYSNMIPIYFFEEIGGVLNEAFGEVVKGQSKWYYNMLAAKKHISELKKKYHYSDWDNDTLKFTTEKGDQIEITKEQAMLLVATARREYGDRYKETMHLFKGGIVIPPPKSTVKDIVKRYNKKADGKDEEITRKNLLREIDSRAHRITPKDIQEVIKWLTDEQIEYTSAMTDYLSNDMATLGNEISMELAGIKKFGGKNYIPYNSAENFLFSQPGVNQEARLKHQSFTKDIQHRANTPIVLSDFSTVCADHINRMCMYNALTIPLENLNKVFNYQRKGDDRDTIDVKAEIARVYGQSAVDYITTFIKDMNGNVRNEASSGLMAKTLRLFKKGAVFASASVVVQQPSAVMRAMAYIDPKYFSETTFKFAERSFNEAAKFSALAGIKRMGRFDTGMGATTVEWLLYEKPEGLKDKAKALVDINDSTYRDDLLSAPAAKADELTWGHIWAAVKAEILDTTDLKQGSKEFFEACSKRFDEVINYTQVYDSTISRSQNMRNKSITAQMLTAFMSEPTVTLNCLMKAERMAKTNGKAGKLFVGRSIAALIGNVILNSVLKSLITAGRDDDEDYTYLEKYGANVIRNIHEDLNPFSMIPYIKDIFSIFEGYSVDRADMSLFSDLAKSVKDINNDNKTLLQKTESMAGSLAAFLGLPVKNVLRDVRTAYNIIMDITRNGFNGKFDSNVTGLKYALTESSNAEIFKDLAKAAENGNATKYQSIYQHLLDNGKSDAQIISGIRSYYSGSEEIKKETEEYLSKLNGNKTYNALSVEDRGKLEKEIKSKLALQKVINTTSTDTEKFDTLYTYYRQGQTQKYNSLKKQLLKEGLSNNQISSGMEFARLSYMQSVGVDIHEYLLFKKATSNSYADTDESGNVDKSEKKKAINNIDIDSKSKNFFSSEYK